MDNGKKTKQKLFGKLLVWQFVKRVRFSTSSCPLPMPFIPPSFFSPPIVQFSYNICREMSANRKKENNVCPFITIASGKKKKRSQLITCSHFSVHYIYTPVWWPQIVSKLLWLFVFFIFFNLLIQSCSHKVHAQREKKHYVTMRKKRKKFLAISIINKITFTDTNVFPGW